MVKQYFSYFLLLLSFQTVVCQQHDIDSVLKGVKNQADSSKLQRAREYISSMIDNKEYNEAFVFTKKVLRLAEKIEVTKEIGQAYYQLGNIARLEGEYLKALWYYSKVELLFEKINFNKGLAQVLTSKSIVEQQRGNQDKGANYLQKSNTYHILNNDSISLANSENRLGNLYATLKKFELSKKHYFSAIKIKKRIGLNGIGNTMNNLAFLFIDHKKVDSARTLLLESLRYNKKEKNSIGIAQSYSILAKVELHKKEYLKAQRYYDSTLIYGKNLEWNPIIINAKQQLGYIAILHRDFKKAKRLLTSSRREFEKLEIVPMILRNYELSATLDSTRGNFSDAFFWQKKYQELSDKNATETAKRKIERTEKRYEAEMKQLKLIEEQEKREHENNDLLFRYKLYALITLILSLVISGFLINFMRNRRVRKGFIEELNRSNEVKNKLFSIISHDLKNEIYGLESSLNLMRDNALTKNEVKEIIPLLANSTNRTSILLNNLLNWSRSQLNQLSAHPTLFDAEEVIQKKYVFFHPKAKEKNIKLMNTLEPTKIFADEDMFSIVVQNLISNAIKFCNSGDIITIRSEEEEDNYKIFFKDTGIGIAPEYIDKLFAEDTYSSMGTQNETGTGLGLKICKELIELNQGSISVSSVQGKGSVFCVTLPKKAS